MYTHEYVEEYEESPPWPRKSNKDLLRILGHGLLIWGTVNQLFVNGQMLMESSGKRIGCRPSGWFGDERIGGIDIWVLVKMGLIDHVVVENSNERAESELSCFRRNPSEQWLISSRVFLANTLRNHVLNQPGMKPQRVSNIP